MVISSSLHLVNNFLRNCLDHRCLDKTWENGIAANTISRNVQKIGINLLI